ncbi:hypothetical protein [Rhizobium phaseoli]|uniref:hypothetical protein n=1 Tax=Rhizobium phaseoli TaxID=396 RepID=UPI0007EB5480|nr:hypothetical protein [Rhizobium phaseoli]ANL39270.1 hypothetical protein AMC88_CH00837 [Rhizobium phaseoli]ANL58259.1 hypothetical protein AMC85_CH00837 [Rhizobium phaseoli]
MTFTEANAVEAHLSDLLAGAASACPAQPSIGLARTDGRVAGLGWYHVAPAEPYFFGFQHRSIVGRGRQLQ